MKLRPPRQTAILAAALAVMSAADAGDARSTTSTAVPPPSLPGPDGKLQMPKPPAIAQVAPTNGTSATVMDVSTIESVIGRPVKSEGGEDLGRVVDLLVTTSGQVRAAVIDFGGVLGVGSRTVAVDWKALDFADLTKDGMVRLALTRNQVRMSPEYKAGNPVVILEATKQQAPSAAASAPQGDAHKR